VEAVNLSKEANFKLWSATSSLLQLQGTHSMNSLKFQQNAGVRSSKKADAKSPLVAFSSLILPVNISRHYRFLLPLSLSLSLSHSPSPSFSFGSELPLPLSLIYTGATSPALSLGLHRCPHPHFGTHTYTHTLSLSLSLSFHPSTRATPNISHQSKTAGIKVSFNSPAWFEVQKLEKKY